MTTHTGSSRWRSIGRWAVRVTGVTAAIAGGACSSDGDDEVLVLSASSLTDVMADFETAFEAAEPGVDVVVSLAGSSSLRLQVEQGAPADVVAFADPALMDDLVAMDLIDGATVELFASNRIVLATPLDDPGGVESVRDVSDEDLIVGVCAPSVPCGALAWTVLRAESVVAAIDTEEPDVRSLTAKLISGEVDAGFVYATDAAAFPDDLRVVSFSDGVEASTLYPIAPVASSSRHDLAERFVDFVMSEVGAQLLDDAGFARP